MNTLEIVSWESGRLAITGVMDFPGRLLELLSPHGLRVEYRKGPLFTFSFPERYAAEATRAANSME